VILALLALLALQVKQDPPALLQTRELQALQVSLEKQDQEEKPPIQEPQDPRAQAPQVLLDLKVVSQLPQFLEISAWQEDMIPLGIQCSNIVMMV